MGALINKNQRGLLIGEGKLMRRRAVNQITVGHHSLVLFQISILSIR